MISISDNESSAHAKTGETSSGQSAHMAKVAERYADLESARGARIEKRLEALAPRLDGAMRTALLKRALKSNTASQRIHWLRREADAVNAAAAPIVACRSGCSQCCHTGVLLSEGEARVIGKAIGRAVRRPPQERQVSIQGAMGDPEVMQGAMAKGQEMARLRFNEPCTFLVGGQCSIYAERPMACRQLLNADEDALLCQLVEDQSIRVPYINMQQSQLAYVIAWGENSILADIRDWF